MRPVIQVFCPGAQTGKRSTGAGRCCALILCGVWALFLSLFVQWVVSLATAVYCTPSHATSNSVKYRYAESYTCTCTRVEYSLAHGRSAPGHSAQRIPPRPPPRATAVQYKAHTRHGGVRLPRHDRFSCVELCGNKTLSRACVVCVVTQRGDRSTGCSSDTSSPWVICRDTPTEERGSVERNEIECNARPTHPCHPLSRN